MGSGNRDCAEELTIGVGLFVVGDPWVAYRVPMGVVLNIAINNNLVAYVFRLGVLLLCDYKVILM